MPSNPESRKDAPPSPEVPLTPQTQVPPSTVRVWTQFHDVIFDRMATIETAVIALRQGQLVDEIRKKAVMEAHRLAGSLWKSHGDPSTLFPRARYGRKG